MIKAIFRKVFIDYRRSLIAYSLIFIFYGALMIGFYPSIREKSDEFNTLLQAYPEAMREGFNFSAESFSTLEGMAETKSKGMEGLIVLSKPNILTFHSPNSAR